MLLFACARKRKCVSYEFTVTKKEANDSLLKYSILTVYLSRKYSRPVVSSAQLYWVIYSPVKALTAAISPSSIR